MLFPSLYNLHMGGLLADTLTIVGSGRSQMDCAAFQAPVRAALTEHLPGDRVEAPVVETFLQRIDSCAVDSCTGTGSDNLPALLGPCIDQPVRVHLSTPPSIFVPVPQGPAPPGS